MRLATLLLASVFAPGFASPALQAQESQAQEPQPEEAQTQEAQTQEAQPQEAPGKAYFWMRIWPDRIIKFDPTSDTVVHTLTNKNGVAHGMDLTHDRSRFLVTTGQRTAIEVVDVKSGKLLAEHYFSEPGWLYRIGSIREIPGGTHWYVQLNRMKRELDHFKPEKDEWLVYNHTTWEIDERLSELPKAIRRGAQLSPDGKHWHVLDGDFKIIEHGSWKELGKIDLRTPRYTGMGRLRIQGDDWWDGKKPEAYRVLYSMTDPVKTNRSIVGVLDLDLENLKVANIKEWGASPGTTRFFMDDQKKVGIGTVWGGGRRDAPSGDDPVITLLNVDLANGQVLRKTRVDVRNGLGLRAISPDGKKLYLTGRGHELVVYDDQHRYQKTIELDGETDGWIQVVTE